MSITLTTVERIGAVVADPAAVAGSGFLYTKLIAGEIQLFYRSDLGTVDQLTPSAGTPSPWQRTGLIVDLTVGTDTDVRPTTDNLTVLGTSAKRWASVNLAPTGARVFAVAADANPTSQLGSGSLSMGVGGATPVDLRLSRTAASVLTIDDAAGGGALVVPPTFGTGSLGDFNGAANKTWNNVASSNLYIVDNAGDANASVQITGPGTIRLGAGGASALDLFLTRITGPLRLDVNVGAQFGGDINRFESSWNIRTTRTNPGAGNAITLLAADGVATGANTAFTGGSANLTAGNSQANLIAQADGALVGVTAGNAASGVGGGVANGGNVLIQPGIAGPNGGVSGSVVIQDTSGNGVFVVPPTDLAGKLGARSVADGGSDPASIRWLEVNAQTITSGDVCFTDPGCPICHKDFEDGDDIVLRVIKTHKGENGSRLTRTVPAHYNCH